MLHTTFANSQADIPESYNLYLLDYNSGERILRTSGYCAFASDSVPKGSGSMTAILGKYDDDYQFYINKLEDMDFVNERFTPTDSLIVIPYLKDFEDLSISSKGWTTQIVIGTTNWEMSTYDNFAQISNYDGDNSVSEAWYISPGFDLSEATTPVVTFDNAYNYSGDPLQVMYSSDYDGVSTPSTATWTELSPPLSSGSFGWKNSGNLNLPSNTSVYVAFIYTGSSNDGSTWEIDNIIIRDFDK